MRFKSAPLANAADRPALWYEWAGYLVIPAAVKSILDTCLGWVWRPVFWSSKRKIDANFRSGVPEFFRYLEILICITTCVKGFRSVISPLHDCKLKEFRIGLNFVKYNEGNTAIFKRHVPYVS